MRSTIVFEAYHMDRRLIIDQYNEIFMAVDEFGNLMELSQRHFTIDLVEGFEEVMYEVDGKKISYIESTFIN